MTRPVTPADRYDPLPSLFGLPAHVFRKLSPRGRRIAVATGLALLVALVATAITLAPRISESKREQQARERRQAAQALAAERARLIAEQRPRRGRLADGLGAGGAAGTAAAIAELEGRILRDAEARVASGQLQTRAREADCQTLSRRGARVLLSCTAVTSRVEASAGGSGVLVGYPYRAALFPATGNYVFCKVSGRPAEGLYGKLPPVTLPRACGG